MLLPYVLEAYGESAHRKCKDIAIAMHIAEIRRMNAAMNIPDKLPGIRPADIPKLASYADKEANPLYPVPKLMDAKALEQFYYDVMEEQP